MKTDKERSGWSNPVVRMTTNARSIPGLLLLVAALIYANSFPGTFILDDLYIARDNPLVQHPDLAIIFCSDYWYDQSSSGLFRPLTILSLGLNRLLLGPGPLGFHLINVLLHAGTTVLLYRALRVWGVPILGSGIAALLFAVHPLHTEVVDVVVGRSELLVALFLLCAFVIARRRSFAADLLVCLCYLLALLSKEHAVTFLALLPLWDAFAAGSPRVWRQRWPLYAGLLAVAILWQLWVHFGVRNPLPSFPVAEAAAPLAFVDGTTRVLTALHHQWLYLFKMLVPTGLQAVYSVADLPAFITSPFAPAGLLVIAATGGALALLIRGWRRRSLPALFGSLYVVAFLPTSNIIFPIGVTVAERLSYFPSVWFCAGLGVLFATGLEQPRPRRWVGAALVCYVLWLGGSTVWRNFDYTDEVRLWSAEVANNSKDFLGWQNLADSLFSAGQVQEADTAYQWMLKYAPDYPGGLRGRTAFFLKQQLYAEALPSAARVFALSQAQGDPLALAFDGLDLAETYRGLDDCERALTYLDGPSLPLREQLQFVAIRSGVLSCLGRDAEVLAELARVDPTRLTPPLRYQFGISLFRVGRLSEARGQLEEVLRGGGDAEAWNLLGVICAQQADWTAAVAAFVRAVELLPERADFRENLLRAQQDAEGVR